MTKNLPKGSVLRPTEGKRMKKHDTGFLSGIRQAGHCRQELALVLAAAVVVFLPCGCTRSWDNGQTSSTIDQLPSIIAPLPSDLQDARLNPRLIWIPNDSRFSGWATTVTSDGWIAAGEYYSSSQGQGARLDYHDQEGLLKWSCQRSLAEYDSCYLCAARRPDGSIIAGGRTSDGQDPEIGLLTAFDADGQLLWEKSIDYPDDPNIGLAISRCLIAADGRILVVAYSTQYYVSIYEGTQPTVLVCFDEKGVQLWQKEIDFAGMSYNLVAALAGSGGFYLGLSGYTASKEQQSEPFSWLLEIGRDGQELWRKELIDQRYQYEAQNLAIDPDGNLLLSCRAVFLGEIPAPPVNTSQFNERYSYYSYNPAALLKMDQDGNLVWQRFLNGEFGASGQDIVCEGSSIYWKVRLTDDIVKPYIFMSMDHRAIEHEIIAVLDASGEKARYHQFSRENSNWQLIQRIENGQPVLIGWEPVKEDPSWTETLPEDTTAQPAASATLS
jgi:hypothetical protein